MKILNCTPHALNIYNESGVLVNTVEPSGTVARVTVTRKLVGIVYDMPVYKTTYGEIDGLPEYDESKMDFVVVSGLVRSALKDTRPDVYQPGELKRDDDGRVIGCIGLTQ